MLGTNYRETEAKPFTCNSKHRYHVRFEVFTAVAMKNAVFWDVTDIS
jgi:hypothetical protein